MSLLMQAVFEEHKQRTGHDHTRRDDPCVWCCTVCNALAAEQRRIDDEYNAECEAERQKSAPKTCSTCGEWGGDGSTPMVPGPCHRDSTGQTMRFDDETCEQWRG